MMKKLNVLFVIILALVFSGQVFAGNPQITNERFALGAMSLCALNETLQGQGALDVYVLGNIDIAEELKIFLDQRVGFIKLNSIIAGDKLPSEKPDVLMVCDPSKCKEAIRYCRDNNVFSVTNVSELCRQGLATAIVTQKTEPGENKYSMTSVFAKINKEALYAEGMVFNPQVMDIAKPVEDNQFDQDLVMVQLY
ncbi:MAG: hypothetical protein ACLFQM_05440 [Fidelibacterota bacterium]